MTENQDTLPVRVTMEGMLARIVKTEYSALNDGKTTLCMLHIENGFTILGTSACVDPAQFNKALGEKYSFEKAVEQMWPLEGYLLAENRYQESLK
jgi:hypothetical protein